MRRLIILFLILSFMLSACIGREDNPKSTRADYSSIEFLTGTEKEAWRDPLIKLLSNRAIPYGSGGEIEGYNLIYPDQPCIAEGNRLGLFDMDMNGVPELLVDTGGGSAGNIYCYVYDIITGDNLGSINGGLDGSWCVYYRRDKKAFECIGRYTWYMGFSSQERIVHKAELVRAADGSMCVSDIPYLYAFYEVESERVDPTDEQKAQGISIVYEEVPKDFKFRVNGEPATMDRYFSELDYFEDTYVRISETEVQFISWDDVCEYGEDQSVRAQKMTDALLSSDQIFLKFIK